MTDDERKEFLDIWTAAGAEFFGPDGPIAKGAIPGASRMSPDRLRTAIRRFGLTLPAEGVALCMPVDEPPAQHAHAASMRLCHDGGLLGFCAKAKSPAATREMLLRAAIQADCDRALFLGSDSLIDRQGLWQLMATMDRHGAAVVAAVTVVPSVPGAIPTELGAYVGQDGAVRRMVKDDAPRSGVAFPVHHLDGISAMLVDLVQIRRYQGPCFSSRTEGTTVVDEDEGFAKWLDMHGLSILVDPKAQALRLGQQLFGWRWEPPKDEE